MAKEYLDKLTAFMDKASPDCFGDVSLECKHFFAGAAVYADRRICISLTPVGLALKLSEETKTGLLQSGSAVPLRYFPQAPIKKGYVLFPGGIEDCGDNLYEYVRESVGYVLTLQRPKRM